MWFWGILAMVSLLWPSRLTGLLDGIPLDRTIEAVGIGVVFPVLWWWCPGYLNRWFARACIAALLTAKLAAAFMVQGGWCLAFEPPRPMVRDSTGKPHAWDVRADWRSPDPACSAIMARGYPAPPDFPVQFFNLAPPDDTPSADGYFPGQIPVRVTASGFIDVTETGELSLVSDAAMQAVLTVDGARIKAGEPGNHAITLAAGPHLVHIDATLLGKSWKLVPSWNGAPMGTRGFPQTALRPPPRIERPLRGPLGGLMTILAAMMLVPWILAAASSLRRPRQLGELRTAFLMFGVPWIVFVTAINADQIGRWTGYFVGVDNWSNQRFAYRIFMQGYWLEGGQPTFWLQPLYRWIVGALHMAFGDSSVGQAYWDGACAVFGGLFAFEVARRFAGFRMGLLAGATLFAMLIGGPNLEWVGFGLSEFSAAGFLSLAALFAVHGRTGSRAALVAAGIFATLAFYTRLNHLPMALAVAAFALPFHTPASALFRRETWRRIVWPVAGSVVVAVGLGLVLFAWRTWYYTGVFSVLHGTQSEKLAVWQSGTSLATALPLMAGSLMMVLTSSDPPRWAWHALPLLVAAGASLLGIAGVARLRRLPLPLVLFFFAGCSSALVARGWAHDGRFSIHLLPIGSALTVCAVAAVFRLGQASADRDL